MYVCNRCKKAILETSHSNFPNGSLLAQSPFEKRPTEPGFRAAAFEFLPSFSAVKITGRGGYFPLSGSSKKVFGDETSRRSNHKTRSKVFLSTLGGASESVSKVRNLFPQGIIINSSEQDGADEEGKNRGAEILRRRRRLFPAKNKIDNFGSKFPARRALMVFLRF